MSPFLFLFFSVWHWLFLQLSLLFQPIVLKNAIILLYFLSSVRTFCPVIPKGSFSSVQFSSVQSLSRVQLLATPWVAAHQASQSITNTQSSLKLMSIESGMLSSHLILGRPLLLLPPIPIPPSIRVFSNESTLHMRWSAYSASASFLPKNTQDWSPLEWTDCISLQSKGLSQYTTEQIIIHSKMESKTLVKNR